MMKHHHPQLQQLLLCDRRGLHAEEPLDMVCTNLLCRENPLACSVCFDQTHKHHKVVQLSKFMAEFSRHSGSHDRTLIEAHLLKAHQSAKGICKQLRNKINTRIDDFERDIDDYKLYILAELDLKNHILRAIKADTSPQKITSTVSLDELKRGVRFLLNNTDFDDEANLSKIASPLQANNDKLQSLISKLEYIPFECSRKVDSELERMNTLVEILQQEKLKSGQFVHGHLLPDAKISIKGGRNCDSTTHKLAEGEQLDHINTTSMKPFSTPLKSQMLEAKCQSPNPNTLSLEMPKFKFTLRHPNITLNNQAVKSSNVFGKEAQFALATPSLDGLPTSKWAMRIISCKDIFCNSSLAVGVCHLNHIKSKHLSCRANDFTDCYMLNAKGEVLTPECVSNNPQMKFQTGDVLEFQYDSVYRQLEIRNEEGVIVSMSIEKREVDPLYVCVRMNFQGDAVELINH